VGLSLCSGGFIPPSSLARSPAASFDPDATTFKTTEAFEKFCERCKRNFRAIGGELSGSRSV